MLQRFGNRRQLGAVGHSVESANACIYWMDLAPAKQAQEVVAGLLERQRALHRFAMIARHRNRVRIAEEVWRMQHHNVQRMALNPFAAIEQSAQRPDWFFDIDAERILDGVHSAHLVGDWANPADPRDDIEHLAEAAPAQQCLEETWRLEDAEAHRIDLAIANAQFERALPLHARDIVDPDSPIRHGPRSPSGTPQRPH